MEGRQEGREKGQNNDSHKFFLLLQSSRHKHLSHSLPSCHGYCGKVENRDREKGDTNNTHNPTSS